MAKNTSFAPASLLRKLFPLLAFCFGLFGLVILTYGTGYSALPTSENRYSSARSHVENLKTDAKRSNYRDQWLRLADEFLDIYKKDQRWPNRPAALFRSAETLEELGKRSFAVRDFQEAVKRYERVATEHPKSQLADDALLRAAYIRSEQLQDTTGALRNLRCIRVNFSRGDMADEAASLEKRLRTPQQSQQARAQQPSKQSDAVRQAAAAPQPQTAQSKQTPPARAVASLDRTVPAPTKAEQKPAPAPEPTQVTRISWRTLSRHKVQITVELNNNARWEASMNKDGNKSPARLTLTVHDATPAKQIKAGAKVNGSLLTKVMVAQPKQKITTLGFDFSSARRYDTRVELNPFRIVLTVVSSPTVQRNPSDARILFAEAACPSIGDDPRMVRKAPRAVQKPAQDAPPARVVAEAAPVRRVTTPIAGNLAVQLGLGVQTVYIDAGHGGRDPGTSHHDLVERELVLDIAKRVGRLLTANGFDVQYTRTKNTHVPLSARPVKANAGSADLFISIHLNANPSPDVQGFETYYLDFARTSEAAKVAALENVTSDRKLGDMQKVLADIMLNTRTQESRNLARDIQRMSLSRLKRRGFALHDGGVRSAPFHVLIGANMPAILVEVGYCTNKQEAARLATSAYRHSIAEGIAEGVMAYKNNLQRRQSAEFTLTGAQASAM